MKIPDLEKYEMMNEAIEDALYSERKAQWIQEEMRHRRVCWKEKAKELSDRELLEEIYRELLEEIYVMLKAKINF